MVNARDKYLALKRIADFFPRIYAIIFCRTKIETQELPTSSSAFGYNAESLHGNLSQQQRNLTMQKFHHHLTQLLVATNVATRGLDVDNLTHVINYEMPNNIESYTHRSGRTGRAAKKGTSIAIVHTREKQKIRAVEKVIDKKFSADVIPSPQKICKKQLFRVMDIILKTNVDEEQIAPFMTDVCRYFEYIDKKNKKYGMSLQFGKFLSYYANAPQIATVSMDDSRQKGKKKRGGERQAGTRQRQRKGPRTALPGYPACLLIWARTTASIPAR